MALSSISTAAVTRLRTRMLFLDQAALLHQLFVEFFVLLYPFRILAPGGEGRLECAVADVTFVFRRLCDFTQKTDMPLDGVLRHIGRPEDAPKQAVGDVRAEGLFDGRNPGPILVGNTLWIKDRERLHAFCLPVAYAFRRVVHR